MNSLWPLVIALAIFESMLLTKCQSDLELDYSNEYDDVRPHLVYPDEPRLEKRLAMTVQQFGENLKDAWESMVKSFQETFGQLQDVFATGVDGNVGPLPPLQR